MFAFAKLRGNAILPIRHHLYDAGADLSSCEYKVVKARSRECVDTGIAVVMPQDCYARIAPRSGLAFKFGIDVFAGVVDHGYTNSIKVILYNSTDVDFSITPGDKIAQIIFEKIYTPQIVEIQKDEIPVFERGLNGFGSTTQTC